MSRVTIRLFGYPSILVEEKPVRLERRKSLALLAYLSVNAGPDARGSCSREVLGAMFWPDSSQSQAGAYLRQALWEISKSVGDEIIIRDGQITTLNLAADTWIDIRAFEECFSLWKTDQHNDAEVSILLSKAQALYTGDFLAGLTLPGCAEFESWQSIQSEILRGHLAQALEALSDLKARAGDLETASDHARRWLSLDPLDEAAHRAMMRVLIRQGEYAAALRQYETCRKLLEAELGVSPSTETQAVLTEMKQRASEGGGPARVLPDERAARLTSPFTHPSGTVTFLFTDIEGSTRLWEQFPQAMRDSFARQEAIIREMVAAHHGYVYKMIGDAFQVAFSLAPEALGAAVDAQRALQSAAWGITGPIRVRMALHTGMVEERADDYVGPTLNRLARILSAGHGGQILLNQPTCELLRDGIPGDVTLRDLGECWLKDLSQPEHLYQVAAPGLPEEFPPLKALNEPVPRLPVPQTPFIGRKTELAHIRGLLENPGCRLVTLVGIGGSGKTRLAIEAARQQSELYPQGACFADLTNSASLAEIIAAVARAVGQVFHTPAAARLAVMAAQEQLFDFLCSKEILVVLDNYEHLTEYAFFVSQLLEAAPHIRLIVTSRERLNLPGEWIVEISGLPFPGKKGAESAQKYAAVQLFLKGAERAAGCALAEDDLPAVARICQLLEGMPLGVEMAAAWTKMLPCHEIASEIERNIDFLSAEWRGMPERHRTLRAVFEYSWRLLSEEERETLLHLAVFRGGFSRENARVVADASLPLLSALVDKSFLRRSSPARFEVQAVLHPFIVEKLASDPNSSALLRGRHATYYFDWLLKMETMLKGGEQIEALAAMRSDMLNLLAAWQFLVEQRDYQRLNRCLPVMILFDVMHDQFIEQGQINRALLTTLEMLQSSTPTPENDQAYRCLQTMTLAGLRFFAVQSGQLDQIAAYEQKSLQLLEVLPDCTQKADAMILNCIGPGWLTLEGKKALALRAKDLYDRIGDPWGTTLAQMTIADQALFGRHDFNTAREAYQSSLVGFATLDNLWGRALCLVGLLFAEMEAKHLEAGYRYGLECLEILSRLDSRSRQTIVHHGLGEIAEAMGDFEKARAHFHWNIEYFSEIGALKQRDYFQDRLDAVPANR